MSCGTSQLACNYNLKWLSRYGVFCLTYNRLLPCVPDDQKIFLTLRQGKDLDYEAMAREHRALAAIIREHSGGKRVEPDDKLTLRTQVLG